jgi:hypothetical protein
MQRKDGRIHLSGRGRVPDAPLCAMCKVDGAFVLMPIDEVTSLRPDIMKFVSDESARLEAVKLASGDAEYVQNSARDKAMSSRRASGPSTSDAKAPQLNTVKVGTITACAYLQLSLDCYLHSAALLTIEPSVQEHESTAVKTPESVQTCWVFYVGDFLFVGLNRTCSIIRRCNNIANMSVGHCVLAPKQNFESSL